MIHLHIKAMQSFQVILLFGTAQSLKLIAGFLQASCGSMRPELSSVIRKHEFLDN